LALISFATRIRSLRNNKQLPKTIGAAFMEQTSKRPVFSEDANGDLIAMRPSAPANEDELQVLIANYPEIVSDGERLILVRREQGLPDKEGGGNRWSLDHLFLTASGVPVLLEVKRASDTRIRREVIGQLLDYAANGVAYWPVGHLREAFLQTCREADEDPDSIMNGFLIDKSVDEFWTEVDENLSTGRIQLIVAADAIPAELARIIEFLNEQMKCVVKAIELSYFESEDGRKTLVPRIIGETEKTKASKSVKQTSALGAMTHDEWFDLHVTPKGPEIVQAAKINLEIVTRLGGSHHVASTQGSIVAKFISEDGTPIWPWSLTKNGEIELGFRWIKDRPHLQGENIRTEFLDRFQQAVPAMKRTPSAIKGYPTFSALMLNDPGVAEKFESVMQDFVKCAKMS
jgi:hypothetical protein